MISAQTHAPVISSLHSQLGSGPQWSMDNPGNGLALAQWQADDVQLIHPQSRACTLIFHLSGSTRVAGFMGSQCVGQGARHCSVTLLGAESTRWELSGELSFVHLYLPLQTLDEYVQRTQGIAKAPWLKPCFAREDPWLSAFFSLLIQDRKLNDAPAGAQLLSQLSDALLAHLLRFYSHRAVPSRPARPACRLSSTVLARIDEHLRANLIDNVALADLARLASLSEGHLIRAFRLATGMTPHQMLIARRIEKAVELMQSPELTVSQIALQTGFTSASHLGATFKRLHGVTPGQYRALQSRSIN